MKTNRKARLRIVAIALIVLVIVPLATVRRAHAYGQGGLAAGVIMVWATYLTAKTLICTPVAALKASEAEGSFATAFKACWNWRAAIAAPEEPVATEISDRDPDAPTSGGEPVESPAIEAPDRASPEPN